MTGLTGYVSLSVRVDWNNDGAYSQPGDDVSADVRYPVSTSRGRSAATDEPKAGSARFALRNGEGTYTPFNSASPLYPHVIGGRPVTIVATYLGVEYPVFVGRCGPETGRFAPDGQIEFAALDAFEELRKGKTSTELLRDMHVHEVIGQVLDDIGWPALKRLVDAPSQLLSVFANKSFKEAPLTTLQLAARQELGGMVLIDRGGNFCFYSRDHWAKQPVYATLSGTFDDLIPTLRQEDLVDTVRGAYARFAVDASLSAVYTMSADGRPLYPGLDARNRFEVTFNGIGATGVIEPVAVTDYTANTQPDGSGTDSTAQVVVHSLSASSKGGAIWFENLDSGPLYLSALQIRGYAIQGATEDNVIEVEVTSPLITGQQLDEQFEYNDDGLAVGGWAGWQASWRGTSQPRLTLSITADTDALMAIVLGAEIGKRVTVSDTGAPWLTQVTGDYFIEGIDLEIKGPGEVTATWTLLSSDMVAGSMAAISSDLDAIARGLMFVGDFAVIASDSATTGAKVGY